MNRKNLKNNSDYDSLESEETKLRQSINTFARKECTLLNSFLWFPAQLLIWLDQLIDLTSSLRFRFGSLSNGIDCSSLSIAAVASTKLITSFCIPEPETYTSPTCPLY
jgi:hypothetical protein